jgi:hypothetical protein
MAGSDKVCEKGPPSDVRPEAEWISIVRAKVEGLRFGVVQVIVHDSKVVQVERTEKIRLQ